MVSRVRIHFLSQEILRLIRFLFVGMSGTIIDFGILYLLKTIFLVPLIIANTVSYSAGIVNNYTLNRYWTFAEKKSDPVSHQFGKFLAVNVFALILNNLIVILANHPISEFFENPQTGYLYSKVLATIIVVIWNYSANRLWTFR